MEVELVCTPAFDYGQASATWTLVGSDRHTADATGDGQTFRLRTDLALGIEGNRVRGRRMLHAGERALLRAVLGEGWPRRPTSTTPGPDRRDRRLLADVAGQGPHPRPPLVEPAAAVGADGQGPDLLPTGAAVAALTTSLPETPGGERNWDYRYTWMRDATFTLQALHWLNLDWEADEFMQFVADLEPNEDGALQIMYGIDGRRDLTESTVDDLSGYEGARPVRVGNGAFDQRQNDVFGAVLDSILMHSRRSQRLPRRLWPIVKAQAECATAVWREPDQGIWEARGEPRHYVSSKLMGWVALDRAAMLAEIRGDPEQAAEWRQTAEEIRDDILAHGVSERGVLRQHYDTDALDASTLLAAIFGLLPPDDQRLRSDGRRDRRRTDRGRLRPALQDRRDR